ncbi:minor capsid protein [Pseudanabaena sp. FACHB-2040]|uniref:minor capsid protein n=1 Tax=Pseudanabaena sp. FACHB-2040 TaxID=2692859 RepID=UPI0016896F2A|nr:minor capsid protein [Pseudanabaena sp. FACHB-2040]MBD2261365.1 minor capsid protein [Pseudanabaena sp. FACHB-2040]
MPDYRKLENLVERYSNAVAGLDADVVERLSDALDASYRNLERELRKIYPEWESMGSLYAAQRRLLLMDQLKPVLAMVRPDQEAEYEALFTEAIRLSHTSGGTLADELVRIVDPGYPLQEFSTIPIEAAALQARDGLQRLRRHDEKFRSKASAIVEQGLLQGWGAAKVAQQLASELGALKSKAETIARTETMSAFNDAAQQRYEKNGIEGVQWLITPNENLCSICVARNGNVYPVGKVRLPAHPRCLCIWLPWSKDWQEMGLIDEAFMRDYHRDNLTKAKGKGIEPDNGPTYWERKAGQQKAPKPLWKPANKAGDAKAEAVAPKPKPKQGSAGEDKGPVVVRPARPKGPEPAVPQQPYQTPAATRRWEDGKRLQPFESAAIFDSNGSLIFEKDGGSFNVEFSDAELRRLRGQILTHNHPPDLLPEAELKNHGYSFSQADILFAIANDLQEMRVVSPGYRFSLLRPEGGWPEWTGRSEAELGKSYQKILNGEIGRLLKEMDEALGKDPDLAKALDRQFNTNATHEAARRFAEQEGLIYKRERWKEQKGD